MHWWNKIENRSIFGENMDKRFRLISWATLYTGQAYMDMDMDGKFHIHSNPAKVGQQRRSRSAAILRFLTLRTGGILDCSDSVSPLCNRFSPGFI